jgi:hypothetical protein
MPTPAGVVKAFDRSHACALGGTISGLCVDPALRRELDEAHAFGAVGVQLVRA